MNFPEFVLEIVGVFIFTAVWIAAGHRLFFRAERGRKGE